MASFKIKVGLAGDLAASRMKVDIVCLPDERDGYRLTTCSPSSAAVRAYTSAPWRGTKTPGISDGASVTKREDTIYGIN